MRRWLLTGGFVLTLIVVPSTASSQVRQQSPWRTPQELNLKPQVMQASSADPGRWLLYGAAAGAIAFGIVEATTPHTSHEWDLPVAVMYIAGGGAIGFALASLGIVADSPR